jgi:phosphate starvation-inducible protein PhoH and related proteins
MAKRKQSLTTTQQPQQKHFELRTIKPLTLNQQRTFKAYDQGTNLVLHGYAGTGKTFISMYLALDEILNYSSEFTRVCIVRSIVSSRNPGFLPGGPKEKASVFEEPYHEICDDLFGRGGGYQTLKQRGIIDFTTTSFLRGRTFRNAIMIVDEPQNMTFHELDTVMTRVGDNTKIIFTGDFRQSDMDNGREKSGLIQFMNIIKQMKTNFEYIEFGQEDIVRSGIVKDYIITRTQMEYA